MSVTGPIQFVYEQIHPLLQQIADDIQSQCEVVSPEIFSRSTGTRCLIANLSFITSRTSDELAVVSVDGQKKGDIVFLTSDVADGHGKVAVDGPSCTISALIEDPAEVLTLVSPWLDELREFLATRGLEETRRLVREYIERTT